MERITWRRQEALDSVKNSSVGRGRGRRGRGRKEGRERKEGKRRNQDVQGRGF